MMNLFLTPIDGITEDIKEWGKVKGITDGPAKATIHTQFAKSLEEVSELAMAIAKRDYGEFKDAVGDVYVTLVLLCELRGVSIRECIETAYETIKVRTGKMVNGTFVKDK